MANIQLPALNLEFNEAAWVDLLPETNCYAYALNCPYVRHADPGHLNDPNDGALPISWLQSNKIKKALAYDGLIEISASQALAKNVHAIALLLNPGKDFHFLRRDQSGWSHKPGRSNITRFDDREKLVKDPLTATFKNYPEFIGYFAIPATGVPYAPMLAMPASALPYFSQNVRRPS